MVNHQKKEKNMNKQYGITLIKNIDKYCSKKGITRKDFAREINIQPNTMGNWKTNNSMPPVETLIKIASIIGCSIESLIGAEPLKLSKDFAALKDYLYTLKLELTEHNFESVWGFENKQKDINFFEDNTFINYLQNNNFILKAERALDCGEKDLFKLILMNYMYHSYLTGKELI